MKLLDFRDRQFIFEFPYNAYLIKDLRDSVRTAWFDGANKQWTATALDMDSVLEFCTRNNFSFTDDAKGFLGLELTLPGEINYDSPAGSIKIIGDVARFKTDGFPGWDVVSAVKNLPGAFFNKGEEAWLIPITTASIPLLTKFADNWGYPIVNPEAIEEQHEAIKANIESSAALDAELDISSLGLELLPFQKAGVSYAINNISPGKGVYIADEMGLGKTPMALATLQAKEAFPALVVVPKVVYLNWVREVSKWLPGRSVCLLGGKNITKAMRTTVDSLGATIVGTEEDVPEADIYILNYELLSKWAKPTGQRVGNGVKYSATGKLSQVAIRGLVFDEAHLLKERKSQRTKAASAVVNTANADVVLALSGTPIPNRPSELITVIKDILKRLPEVGGWRSMWSHHCLGWAGGANDLEGLNEKMRASFYVRRLKKDVLPELPPIRWVDVAVEMSNPKHYSDVEADLYNWYREKLEKDEEFLKTLEGLDDLDKEIEISTKAQKEKMRKARDEFLVKINALRQVAAREKLPAVIEWIENFLEESGDEKVIVFGIHRDINEALSQHFNSPLIYGGMTDKERLDAEDSFQKDPSVRCLFASIDAAGVGLTLTAASNVVFVEIPWRPMDLDQAVARTYGRISDIHGVTSYQIISPGTIEDKVLYLIAKKRELIEQGADGKSSVLSDLVKQLTKEIKSQGK